MTGVIYARYSSDNQREESIEGQLRENARRLQKRTIFRSSVHILTVRYRQRRITALIFKR